MFDFDYKHVIFLLGFFAALGLYSRQPWQTGRLSQRVDDLEAKEEVTEMLLEEADQRAACRTILVSPEDSKRTFTIVMPSEESRK